MDIQQFKWKLIERPLLPVENSWVDAAPFVAIFVLFGLALVAIFGLRKRQPIRHLIQFSALVIFALTFHRCFCAMRGWVFGLSEIGKDNLSLFQNTCIFIPVVAFVFAFGRIFCGWLCPLGTIQEALRKLKIDAARTKALLLLVFLATMIFLLWRLRPENYFLVQNVAGLLGISLLAICLPVTLKPKLDLSFKKIKYVYLALWTALIVLGVFVTDPWCGVYGNEIDYSSLVGLSSVMLAGIIISMAWCRYICPLGALFSLLSKFYAYKVKGTGEPNNRYKTTCPMTAIKENGQVDNANCIFCLRCNEKFGFKLEQNDKK